MEQKLLFCGRRARGRGAVERGKRLLRAATMEGLAIEEGKASQSWHNLRGYQAMHAACTPIALKEHSLRWRTWMSDKLRTRVCGQVWLSDSMGKFMHLLGA